jgi:TRAP-type mannitol/chloroaromatic compound transport system permease small subunit
MYYIKKIILFIDRFNNRIGIIFSVIVFPMVFILVYEVMMRYAFNRPTIWAHELSAILYAIFFLIGGVYTLRWDSHVRVDVFYNKLSRRAQNILDLFTWILFYIFIGIMFWEGSKFAYTSIMRKEISNTAWAPYIWPVKLFIPVAAFLMLLQGFTKTTKDIYFLFTNKDLIQTTEGEKK